MAITPDVFKAAMGQYAAGVTIVTMNAGGEDHGFTASSFTSLSIEPMLVLVCVVKAQRGHDLIQESKHFAVNILSNTQQNAAGRFASPDTTNRFADVTVTRAQTGAPILQGNLAWVDCRLHSVLPGGDHSIFVGEVVDGAAPGGADPLLYFNRAWGTFDAT